MSTPARKMMKVETSESGRRYVNARDVVRGELARIREKASTPQPVRENEQPVNQNGNAPAAESSEGASA